MTTRSIPRQQTISAFSVFPTFQITLPFGLPRLSDYPAFRITPPFGLPRLSDYHTPKLFGSLWNQQTLLINQLLR